MFRLLLVLLVPLAFSRPQRTPSNDDSFAAAYCWYRTNKFMPLDGRAETGIRPGELARPQVNQNPMSAVALAAAAHFKRKFTPFWGTFVRNILQNLCPNLKIFLRSCQNFDNTLGE